MFSPTRGAAKVAKDGDDFMAIRTAGARGSAPGERRGGRAKGTPNRQTQLVRDRLAELNCDPVQGLVKIATDPSNTPELRAKVYADLLAFSAPKPKAIELTAGEMAEPQELIVRWLPSSE